MADNKAFQCPNCGSPLTAQGSDKETKCPYCGSTVIVPEELRDKPAPKPAPRPVSYSTPVYYPQNDDQIAKNISTVGKVATGIAISSMIAPIVITLVVFCIVGVFLVFLFWGINSTFQTASQVGNPSALQTQIVATLLPDVTDTPVPEATAAPTPIPVATAYTRVLVHDTFATKKNNWDQSSNSDYTLGYVKGGYRIFINTQDSGQASWIDGNFKDLNVQADVRYTAGPVDGRFGLICRAQDKVGFYGFEFSTDGSYSIQKFDSSGNADALAEGSLDPNTVDTSGIMHMRGDCVGDTLTLYLNGNPLLQVTDTSFTTGGVGMIARTGPSGDPGVDVLFSNYSALGK